jgi:hypothetical protein
MKSSGPLTDEHSFSNMSRIYLKQDLPLERMSQKSATRIISAQIFSAP